MLTKTVLSCGLNSLANIVPVYSRYREALTKELPCLGIEEIADYDVGTMKETVKSEKA